MTRMINRGQRALLLICAISFVVQPTFGQDKKAWLLTEPIASTVSDVNVTVDINGHFLTSGDGGAIKLELQSKAAYNFLERRIEGSGREAKTLRSLRHYKSAQTESTVGTKRTKTQIPDSLRTLVARGKAEGVEFFNLSQAMNRTTLDMLNMPCDTLPVVSLLPDAEVEVGETWAPPVWTIQMLCGVEAVLESKVECKLKSANAKEAEITVVGTVSGATYGARCELAVSGTMHYDMANKRIDRVAFKQAENRSVGAVSPGMEIVAAVSWTRVPTKSIGPITDQLVATVPMEPAEKLGLLSFTTPWNASFPHDRNWHVFHTTPKICVLRLVEKGNLIAQINVSEIMKMPAGQHTSEQQFQNDIRQSLGNRLTDIEKAELLKTDDGRWLYRVIANGEANNQKLSWVYYLCAAPSGEQTSFVFSLAKADMEKLANRDLAIVLGLKFADTSQVAGKPKSAN